MNSQIETTIIIKDLVKNIKSPITVDSLWKVPIFLDTLSMGQLILPAVHYRRHF